MDNVRERNPNPQALAVAIVASAIDVLRTREGIDVSEALIDERARNAVTALEGAFILIPRRLTPVESLRQSVRAFATSTEALGVALRAEARR